MVYTTSLWVLLLFIEFPHKVFVSTAAFSFQPQNQLSRPTKASLRKKYVYSKTKNGMATTVTLFGTDSSVETEDENVPESSNRVRATVSFSGLPSVPPTFSTSDDEVSFSTTTSIIDYILSLLTSDLGSIVIGIVGLSVTLCNRLFSIDFEASSVARSAADAMGMQSRADLLAVFSCGAVLLNGISKLDVTSVMAETVILEGMKLSQPVILSAHNNDEEDLKINGMQWAIDSVLDSTPADTAVVLLNSDCNENDNSGVWVPVVVGGTIPTSSSSQQLLGKPLEITTPILNRFLRQADAKESYLPTLQALPGKVEFTYLPLNTQEALLIPIPLEESDRVGKETEKAALVLGGATPKNFSPRDVAWCQVLASRLGKDFPKSIILEK